MFPLACFSSAGRLRVKLATVPSDASYNCGVPCGPDFVYGDFNSPQRYQNGLPMVGNSPATHRISMITGTFDHYENGLPFALNGALNATTIGGSPNNFHNGFGLIDNAIAVDVVS
jgi:hypothetical protein